MIADCPAKSLVSSIAIDSHLEGTDQAINVLPLRVAMTSAEPMGNRLPPCARIEIVSHIARCINPAGDRQLFDGVVLGVSTFTRQNVMDISGSNRLSVPSHAR
jgi:hypothetical protein